MNYWYFSIYCGNLYKEQSEAYGNELASYKTQFYVASADIPAGTKVTMDLLAVVDGYASVRSGLFRAADLNGTAVADIAAGTPLYSNMVYDEASGSGNTVQYTGIRFPGSAAAGNFVDVRIRFQNGNDYVIVSKTKLTGISHDSGISLLTLTETELLYLSSALVDCVRCKAELYATIYSSPETQSPAEITYVPGEDNLPLIYSGETLNSYLGARRIFESQIGEPLL